ncbi:MAG: hypothetical protein JXA73_08130 [Acidobacteria bacterium]|nr:hypothetical protein [Acidobacteriota bacterium]
MKMILLIVSILTFACAAFGQLPQCGAVSGWQQQGRNRAYTSDDLFEYMNGNSEGYFIYRFVGMKGITCQSGASTIVIDISEFEDPEFAYGMFTSTRDPRLPMEKIGTNGQVTPRRIIFVKDRYYVELGANPEKDFASELRTYAAIIEKSIPGQTRLPEMLGWFPEEGLDTARLIPESVLGIRLLKSGYVGLYDFGKAFIVGESSQEAASQLMEKLRARFGQTAPVTIADEAFTATDKYLNGMCVFRKGNYIGGFADLKTGRDGVAESARLAGNIK